MANNSRKIKLWTQIVISMKEDQLLNSLILFHGPKNWKKISSELKTHLGIIRSTKQCRDRWINYLKKGLNNKSLSPSERTKLLKLFENYGASWNKISTFLPGHSENQLKNFINATIRRNIRKYNKTKPQSEKISINSVKLLDCPEVKAILLADKSVENFELRSFRLSSEALEFIHSLEIEEKDKNEEKEEVEEKELDQEGEEIDEINDKMFEDIELIDELDKILKALCRKQKGFN